MLCSISLTGAYSLIIDFCATLIYQESVASLQKFLNKYLYVFLLFEKTLL